MYLQCGKLPSIGISCSFVRIKKCTSIQSSKKKRCYLIRVTWGERRCLTRVRKDAMCVAKLGGRGSGGGGGGGGSGEWGSGVIDHLCVYNCRPRPIADLIMRTSHVRYRPTKYTYHNRRQSHVALHDCIPTRYTIIIIAWCAGYIVGFMWLLIKWVYGGM